MCMKYCQDTQPKLKELHSTDMGNDMSEHKCVFMIIIKICAKKNRLLCLMLLSKPWEAMISKTDVGKGKTERKQLPGHPQYFAG